MNSNYRQETLNEILNLTSSVYKFNNNSCETDKRSIEVRTEQVKHVGSWLCGHASVYTWASEIASHIKYIHMQDMLTRETHKHLRPVSTWAQEDAKHVGMWACKHTRCVGTSACKHTSYIGMWARQHTRHIGMWALKHARHISTRASF